MIHIEYQKCLQVPWYCLSLFFYPLICNLTSVTMQRNHWYRLVRLSLALDSILCRNDVWSSSGSRCSATNRQQTSKPQQPPLKDIFILRGNKLYNIKKEFIWREINIWCTPNRFTPTARWTSTWAPHSSEHSLHIMAHIHVNSCSRGCKNPSLYLLQLSVLHNFEMYMILHSNPCLICKWIVVMLMLSN